MIDIYNYKEHIKFNLICRKTVNGINNEQINFYEKGKEYLASLEPLKPGKDYFYDPIDIERTNKIDKLKKCL